MPVGYTRDGLGGGPAPAPLTNQTQQYPADWYRYLSEPVPDEVTPEPEPLHYNPFISYQPGRTASPEGDAYSVWLAEQAEPVYQPPLGAASGGYGGGPGPNDVVNRPAYSDNQDRVSYDDVPDGFEAIPREPPVGMMPRNRLRPYELAGPEAVPRESPVGMVPRSHLIPLPAPYANQWRTEPAFYEEPPSGDYWVPDFTTAAERAEPEPYAPIQQYPRDYYESVRARALANQLPQRAMRQERRPQF